MTAEATRLEAAGRQTGVAVLLCASLAQRGLLNLADLQRRLRDSMPGTDVEITEDLCTRPQRIRELADRVGSRRLVLGLCRDAVDRRALAAAIRKSGLDMFAVEKVEVPTTSHPVTPEAVDATVLRFRAAAARLAAFSGTAPDQLRPRLLARDRPVSRRSLFTLPPITYEAVPSIERDACLGARACGLCAQVCPARAIVPHSGSLAVDRAVCTACGECVSTCPVGAVTFPGSDLAQREAELDVLLSAPRRPIVFACREATARQADKSSSSTESESRQVDVPCLGAVSVGWMLQVLAAGAPSVRLISCGEECRSRRWPLTRSRVDYVTRLLTELGDRDPAGRVQTVTDASEIATAPHGPASWPVEARARVTLTQPQASAEAIARLAERYGVKGDFRLTHPASPLGLIRVREETCTTCGTCAGVCPTAAIRVADPAGEQSDARDISFDPRLCVACGRCAPSCPEAAFDTLTVETATQRAELARGRRTLARSTQPQCIRCGRPVAPAAMLDRIATMLEGPDESDVLLTTLRQLCSDCRSGRSAAATS